MRKLPFLALLAVMLLAAGAVVAQEQEPQLSNWGAAPYWTPGATPRADGPRLHLQARAEGMNAEAQALTFSAPVPFIAISPCRIVDTRVAVSDGFHQPNFADAETRTYAFPTSTDCPGLPTSAVAYSINVQYRPITGVSFITLFPTGTTLPIVSTLTGNAIGWAQNNAVVAAGTNGSIDVYSQFAGRVVIDINGYYAPQNAGGAIFSNSYSVVPGVSTLDAFLSPAAPGFPGGTEMQNTAVIPAGCMAENLTVRVDTATGGTTPITFTLRVNGANSAMTCVLGTAATSCDSGTAQVSLAAGDLISLGLSGPSDYGSANDVLIGLRCH